MRWSLVVVFACGCGRIAFEPRLDGGAADARDAAATDAPADTTLVCPSAYTQASTGCYRTELVTPVTWLAAEQSCEQDAVGAHLVVIDSAQELQTITALMATNPDVWIGATDLVTEGDYLAVTNEPLAVTTWAPGQPENTPTENCLVVQADGLLGDYDCAVLEEVICEYDGAAAVPAAYGQ